MKPNKDGRLKKRDVVKLVFPLVRLTDVKLKRLQSVEIFSDLTAFEQHTVFNLLLVSPSSVLSHHFSVEGEQYQSRCIICTSGTK